MSFQYEIIAVDICQTVIIEKKTIYDHMHYIYTVWCCYNVINFLQNPHKRHPIARL